MGAFILPPRREFASEFRTAMNDADRARRATRTDAGYVAALELHRRWSGRDDLTDPMETHREYVARMAGPKTFLQAAE